MSLFGQVWFCLVCWFVFHLAIHEGSQRGRENEREEKSWRRGRDAVLAALRGAYWQENNIKRVDELGSEAMTDTHKHIFYTTVQALRQRSSNNHSIMVAHNNGQANFISERERTRRTVPASRRVW